MNRLSMLKEHIAKEDKPLKGKTVVVTGGSRGIGLAIAKICAKDGANVAILAKTTEPHPKLPGTIYTAAKQIDEIGGKGLPLACDIRNEKTVIQCIEKVVQTFGGIDILINNASAINLVGTLETSMKKYDLMHQINIRGTFLVSKVCLPYLIKAKNPHILNMSPPLDFDKKWASNIAYSIAKGGMSMCVLGMAEEFKQQGVAVNALWPRTGIVTAAIEYNFGGKDTFKYCRTDEIMADAAYLILTANSRKLTGHFFIDEFILRDHGVTDFKKYLFDKSIKDEELSFYNHRHYVKKDIY